MQPIPEPLEFTCPKCSSDLMFLTNDLKFGPIQCLYCGFRLDHDPTLFEDGWQDFLIEENEAEHR